MSTITFNVRHLENKDLELEGEIDPESLGLANVDELIHATLPLTYELTVEKMENSALVQGSLHLPLNCECSRCLKHFVYNLDIEDFAAHLEFEGEDPVTVTNDIVDLTPIIREDILLRLPQHPLCEPDCEGLQKVLNALDRKRRADQDKVKSSTWSELNKLKFKD